MVIIRFLNSSESFKGAMASPIKPIPSINNPNPRIMVAKSLLIFDLDNKKRRAPEKSKIGTKRSILRDTINAVTVVPILAPMIIPVA